jgi:hypothetical protein
LSRLSIVPSFASICPTTGGRDHAIAVAKALPAFPADDGGTGEQQDRGGGSHRASHLDQ